VSGGNVRSLESIGVTPANATIKTGSTLQYTATGTYNDGSQQDITQSVTWGSTNTTVATIASGGLATAVAPGSTTIQATLGGITGSTGLSVTPASLVSIALTPANATINAGSTQQYTATGNYSDGSQQNITGSVTWTSTNTAVATIASGGLATAVATGSTTIQATLSGITGSTSLTVSALSLVSIAVTPANAMIYAGSTQQYTATGTYSDGSQQNITGLVAWTSANTAVATVTSGGLVAAVAPGSTTTRATLSNTTGSTALTVSSAPVGSAGATATQYILAYTAANTNQCQIEVSTNSTYSPVIAAVDATKFSGANMDGQTNAGSRAFVVGQKWIAQESASQPSASPGASACTFSAPNVGGKHPPQVTCTGTSNTFIVGDNVTVTGMGNSAFNDTWSRIIAATGTSFTYLLPYNTTATGTSGGGTVTRADRYSLALAANTTYFYRLGGASNTCGASPATGQFTTMNIPNGNTFPELSVVDYTQTPPLQTQPTIFEDRTTIYNDPLTGTTVQRASLEADAGNFGGQSASKYRYCSLTQSHGGYHCVIGSGGGPVAALYWIPAGGNGPAKFLGLMHVAWTDANGQNGSATLPGIYTYGDGTDPNRFYYIAQTNFGNACTLPLAAPPAGATESGNTVTLTTTGANVATFCPSLGGAGTQQIDVSGVGVASYNGSFKVTSVSGATLTYTNATSGLAASGGGQAVATNRLMLGYVEYDGTDNAAAAGANWSLSTTGTCTNGWRNQFCPFTPDVAAGATDTTSLGPLMDACVAAGTVCASDPYGIYSSTKFHGCQVKDVYGDYIKIECDAKAQDQPAWLFAYRISTGAIVAGGSTYNNQVTRWCGEHGVGGSGSAGWMVDSEGHNTDMIVNLVGAITSGTTSFTVTGGVLGTQGEPESQGTYKDATGTQWYILAQTAGASAGGNGGLSGGYLNGDLFGFQDNVGGGSSGQPGEIVRIATKGTCTAPNCTWSTVTRGIGGSIASSHASGARMVALCESATGYSGEKLQGGTFWNFLSDSKRADTTTTSTLVYMGDPASHGWQHAPNIGNGAEIYACDLTWAADWSGTCISGAPSFNMAEKLPFAGVYTDTGNTQGYQAWDRENASFKNAAVNDEFFLGGTIEGQFTKVAGHTFIYKMTTPWVDVTPSYLLPYMSMQGLNVIKDISAPSSVLPDTGSNEVCYAVQANECLSGSSVGDVYADLASVDAGVVACKLTNASSPYTGKDWCFFNNSMYGNSISEKGIQKGNVIGSTTVNGNVMDVVDSKYVRRVVQTLYDPVRLGSVFVHFAGTDASYFMYDSCIADPHLNLNGGQSLDPYGCQEFLGKVLPQPPADGINRTTFETVTVAVGTAGGATQARLKWGYLENEVRALTASFNWPPTIHFYCTQYQGTCYWNGSATAPSFSSGTFTGLSLNANASLAIGVPQRVLFYQLEYLNGSTVVGTGPMQVVAIP
jgi:hypothetical protein